MRTWRRVLACVLSLTMLSGLCMAGAAEAPATPLSELEVGEKAERGMYTVQREEHDIWHVEERLDEPQVEEKGDHYKDLIVWFAAAIMALLFAEWWLQAKENK